MKKGFTSEIGDQREGKFDLKKAVMPVRTRRQIHFRYRLHVLVNRHPEISPSPIIRPDHFNE